MKLSNFIEKLCCLNVRCKYIVKWTLLRLLISIKFVFFICLNLHVSRLCQYMGLARRELLAESWIDNQIIEYYVRQRWGHFHKSWAYSQNAQILRSFWWPWPSWIEPFLRNAHNFFEIDPWSQKISNDSQSKIQVIYGSKNVIGSVKKWDFKTHWCNYLYQG